MLNFDLKQEEGQWFQIEDGTDECGAFKLRAVTIEENETIDKITVKKKDKVKRGVHYIEEKINEDLAAKMRWRSIIVDWKNVAFDSKKVECTNANKDIIGRNDNFVKWVFPILEELNETNKAVEEAKLKNSEKSSNSTKE